MTRSSAPVAPALPAGTQLFEFEIERLLGAGGFGLVYVAIDRLLQRSIAIKEFMPEALATRRADGTVTARSATDQASFEHGRARFLEEARLLARFEHPALVRVLRFWEANGTAYMAMPYYAGRTLREILRTEPGFATEARLRALVSPLLDALELLHEGQCYHRDIAPDNILVQPDGAPVLLDFGAARRIAGTVGGGAALTVVLKPGYAPIEQYADDGVPAQGPWTDVYGLAALLYTAVTGKPPAASVVRAYRDTSLSLAETGVDGYRRNFLAAIDAGLAVRPEDRPQSIAEFRARLGIADGPGSVRGPRVETSAGPPAHASPTVLGLPAYLGSFHGRTDERQHVLAVLAAHRLVTLTGLGGLGKTRLAVECGRAAEGYATVAFVPLGEQATAAEVADRVRSVLRMDATPDSDPMQQIVAFLTDRDVLLILDGFERLVDAVGGTIVGLLETLPRLRCLVTSRRVLDVVGEQVVVVAPLPLPPRERAPTVSGLLAVPSCALFVDRARNACPGFELDADNAAAVAELCRALDGLPLAIELAAARARSFTPAQLCAGLVRRFELLARVEPRLGRHASLAATIEWSWNLLDPAQQRLFAGLSVFRGGCTAEAVEAVLDVKKARLGLDALVATSLLTAETSPIGATRFVMLDTLQAFAAERLGAADAETSRRHRAYFRELAQARGLTTPGAIAVEFANLVRAIASAVAADDMVCALEIAVALRPAWESRGCRADELALVEQACARCPLSAIVRHEALLLIADQCLAAGRASDAQAYAERALLDAARDPRRRAQALVCSARVDWERRQQATEVLGLLDEALRLAVIADDPLAQADALRAKGLVAQHHGGDSADHARAYQWLERAESTYLSIGEANRALRVRILRAGCLAGLGRRDEARQLLASCEQALPPDGPARDLLAVFNMVGFIESKVENWSAAAAAGRRCVRIAWERQANLALAGALWNLASTLAMQDDCVTVAQLLPFSVVFWERSVGPLQDDDKAEVAALRARCERQLGVGRVEELWVDGSRMTLGEAVALALGPERAAAAAGSSVAGTSAAGAHPAPVALAAPGAYPAAVLPSGISG